jgi:hypothetical protein
MKISSHDANLEDRSSSNHYFISVGPSYYSRQCVISVLENDHHFPLQSLRTGLVMNETALARVGRQTEERRWLTILLILLSQLGKLSGILVEDHRTNGVVPPKGVLPQRYADCCLHRRRRRSRCMQFLRPPSAA